MINWREQFAKRMIDVVDIETGEILGVVTTKYDRIETLFENVMRWMRRHKNYTYVPAQELEMLGIEWSLDTYWVKEVCGS